MKAYAMISVGKMGWIETDKPVAGPKDAIIRPLALAPCTSDIHTVFDGGAGPLENAVLGHEAVGEIVEVGDEVEDFKIGDRVLVPAITPEWNSLEMQEGLHQHENGMFGGMKFTNIKPGVFSEYFHVNNADMNLAIIPNDVSIEDALMVTDMVTTGFHGTELADIKFGQSVAVLGIGAVGLMAVASAALKGAGRIIAVGSRQICQDVALEYGATDLVDYRKYNIVERIMELTDNKGVDRVIVAGGNESMIGTAITILKPGGIVGNINYYSSGDVIPIPRLAWGLGMAHKDIRGGLCPGGRLRMEKLMNMVKYKRVDPSKLITHKLYGFEKIEEALLMMKNKQKDMIKPIVYFDANN